MVFKRTDDRLNLPLLPASICFGAPPAPSLANRHTCGPCAPRAQVLTSNLNFRTVNRISLRGGLYAPRAQVLTTDINGVKRKDVREKMFHIDDNNPSQVSRGLIRLYRPRMAQFAKLATHYLSCLQTFLPY